MPVSIRIILLAYAFTIMYYCLARIWMLNNVEKVVKSDYPWYILGLGFVIIFDIVSIIPLAVWFLFCR